MATWRVAQRAGVRTASSEDELQTLSNENLRVRLYMCRLPAYRILTRTNRHTQRTIRENNASEEMGKDGPGAE
mgnify:CR=1 FL=1